MFLFWHNPEKFNGNYLIMIYYIRRVVLLMVLCVPIFLVAQEQEIEKQDSITQTDEGMSIEQISGETETLRQRLNSLKEVLKPSMQTVKVDSVLDTAYVAINSKRDTLLEELEVISRRDLRNREVEWQNYRKQLKKLQGVLNDRTSDITDVNDELVEELEKWKATKDRLTNSSESPEVFGSLDTVIVTLDDLITMAQSRLDSVFTIQTRLTELILVVDETMSEMKRVGDQMKQDYFTLDAPPIWALGKVDTILMDSTVVDENKADVNTASNKKDLWDKVAYDGKQFVDFVVDNVGTILLQIMLIFLIIWMIVRMKRGWDFFEFEVQNKVDEQAYKILNNPIVSALVVGVLISSMFFEGVIPIFGEFEIMVVLIGTSVLLPKITTKELRLFLHLIILSYLIEIFSVYFDEEDVFSRWIMILNSVVLIGALIVGKRAMKNHPDRFQKVKWMHRWLLPFYTVVAGVSILTNVIGMVNLSSVVLHGVFTSVALGMVVLLSVRIVTSILVVFFKLRKSQNAKALTAMVDATNQRFQPVLIFIGLVLWVIFTLIGFDVYENVIEWFNDSLHIGWTIGDMRFSLGGVLAFVGFFVGALLMAKLAAVIFHDEWMIQALPRGVAPAMSLLLRIIIISIGFYLAMRSAGVDVSKLEFMFGALGVGIGFGLQNVVLNFIAGLILAFERPINLGDTIEIDQEKGVVTNIGVRSSNIRTYSGSEAIIPNGDLISKKVVNWTLANRDRRSRILMKTSSSADPEMVIDLLTNIAKDHELTYSDPAPKTYFYGYGIDGNLDFALMYWTTFSDTLKTDSEISLSIFKALKDAGIQAPIPTRRIIEER
ncbi:mechanosensitive ion channel [bacterium SCSIO 12643]|nr:mechanosensitive ion channel [bacterium SCSIO 12643]